MHQLPLDTIDLILSFMSSYNDFAALLSTCTYCRKYNRDKLWSRFANLSAYAPVLGYGAREKLRMRVLDKKRIGLTRNIAAYVNSSKQINIQTIWDMLDSHIDKYGCDPYIFRTFLYPGLNMTLIKVIQTKCTTQETIQTIQKYKIAFDKRLGNLLFYGCLRHNKTTQAFISIVQAIPELRQHVPVQLNFYVVSSTEILQMLYDSGIWKPKQIDFNQLTMGFVRFNLQFLQFLFKNNIIASYDTLNIYSLCAKELFHPVLSFLLTNKLVTGDSQIKHIPRVIANNSMSFGEFEALCKMLEITDHVVDEINAQNMTSQFITNWITEYEKSVQPEMFTKLDFSKVDLCDLMNAKASIKLIGRVMRYCAKRGAKCRNGKYTMLEHHMANMYKDGASVFLDALVSHPDFDIEGTRALYTHRSIIDEYLSLAQSTHTNDPVIYEVVESLLKNGATANYVSPRSQTLFHYVCKYKKIPYQTRIDLIDLISKYTGDETVTLINTGTETALYHAMQAEKPVQDHLIRKYRAHL